MICSLKKGITPKIRMLCFVLINGVLLNLWCVWILFWNASSLLFLFFVKRTSYITGFFFFFFFFFLWIGYSIVLAKTERNGNNIPLGLAGTEKNRNAGTTALLLRHNRDNCTSSLYHRLKPREAEISQANTERKRCITVWHGTDKPLAGTEEKRRNITGWNYGKGYHWRKKTRLVAVTLITGINSVISFVEIHFYHWRKHSNIIGGGTVIWLVETQQYHWRKHNTIGGNK